MTIRARESVSMNAHNVHNHGECQKNADNAFNLMAGKLLLLRLIDNAHNRQEFKAAYDALFDAITQCNDLSMEDDNDAIDLMLNSFDANTREFIQECIREDY